MAQPIEADSSWMSSDILIIEDSYEDLHMLDRLLQSAGHHVYAARDGASGLRAASSLVPDLVMLDIVLPDCDGFEVCRRLQAEAALSDIPVIFISALQDVDLKARAFDAGALDYIIKPFNTQEVLIRVQHQIELAALRRQLEEHARLGERQHIARELHDSVNQTLFAINATIHLMMMDSASLPAEQRGNLENLQVLSRAAQAEMRALFNELRPSQIHQSSIQKLMDQLVEAYRQRLEAEITIITADVELPVTIKLALYRITQESLNNAAKHAHASHVHVSLMDEGQQIRLIVRDDGCGFDPSAVDCGMGLHTMRERAEQQNIRLNISSAPGKGAQIEAVWAYSVNGM